MKAFLKFIYFTVEWGLIILILTYFGIRIWLYTRFDSVVENLDYQGYVDDLKSTPALPDRVFEAYEKIHHYDERTSTNVFLSSIPIKLFQRPNKHYTCACVDVNYKLVYHTFDRWTVGLHLDKDAGSRKCLEYLLNNFDFLFNQIGIRNASEFYFGKSLEDLTDRELLELSLMTKNPDLYSPLKHPERVEKRLKEILRE